MFEFAFEGCFFQKGESGEVPFGFGQARRGFAPRPCGFRQGSGVKKRQANSIMALGGRQMNRLEPPVLRRVDMRSGGD